jgi:hypothetical protein
VGRPRVGPRDEVSGGGWVGPAKAKGEGPGWVFLPILFLFPVIRFIYNNEPHIKRIHTKAKHQTKTNIFQHDASTIIPLGFY